MENGDNLQSGRENIIIDTDMETVIQEAANVGITVPENIFDENFETNEDE